MLNLSDTDNGDDNDNSQDSGIKPTGMMKVSPNPGVPRQPAPKRGNKFALLAGKPAATVLFIAVVLAGVFLAININSEKTPDETYENETPPPANLTLSLTDDEICGSWTLTDYVGNTGDFDPGIIHGISLYWYYLEFFGDNTLTLKTGLEVKKYGWVKDGDMPGVLPDIITVSEIKNIGGRNYIFVHGEILDSLTGFETPGYYVLRKNREKSLISSEDAINKDLRNYNLSDAGSFLHTVSFNSGTRFPEDRRKMPQLANYQPEYIMERGKNPGLGVRSLHEQGITGKGVSVAIIDEPLLTEHPEYRGKIALYKDFTDGKESSKHGQGAAVASLLAGENTGTAPGVKIYYAAVPSWEMYDAGYYAEALDWIVEINGSLPDGEKIRAVCISPNPENPEPWINVNKYLASFKRATEAGILVIDCTNEHGLIIGALRYDYKNPEDISLCRPMSLYRIKISDYHYKDAEDILNDGEDGNANIIRAPVNYRTAAEAYNSGGNEYYSYQYNGMGRLSWALPYVTGVLSMGWQVNPELEPDEIIKILFDTAYTDDKNNKYIYPEAFIGYLKSK